MKLGFDPKPGVLITFRDRDWMVLPSDNPELLLVKPLGGSEEEVTGIYLPLESKEEAPRQARFERPTGDDLGDITTARLLYDAVRLAFRNGAGPFRCLAKLSFRPRSYQMVPLIMALRQEMVRLLVADDVGVGKTVEALLVAKEMLERRSIERFAVICLPHLCDQWQAEIKAKLGLDAVIIRSNTQARLDREIQGDVSVYKFYPYQIVSIDFIKSETRREVFINECPELVIVDEAHTCARPHGATKNQQQRYALIADIAAKPGQHFVALTATPHSGKPEEFNSLLGLLKKDFETVEVATSSQEQRRELARYFVQRKRSDVEKWLGEETPFPERDPGEYNYELSKPYAEFFNGILEFAKKLVSTDGLNERQKRIHYWTALGLLRGVMSSPAAGIEMLQKRIKGLAINEADVAAEDDENPVHDVELGFETDVTPTQVVEQTDWTEYQRKQLRDFSSQLEGLANTKDDQKLAFTEMIVEDWLKAKFNPVIFCRYIATAKYVGEKLTPLLQRRFPKADVQVITSEDPDDVRKQRIEEMEGAKHRILICTDCLSEGINLQDYFTAVLHYDLPWNPNRLEQREGRVDRFGQRAKKVKAFLLYGADNPIDGVVLDVILRKVREIKKDTGINVPFPEDSKSIIDTISQALLLNPDRKISVHKKDDQMGFDFEEFDEARKAKLEAEDKLDRAKEREKTSRSIFAQNAIKAHEIEADLKETDEAIGDVATVRNFVFSTLNNLLGAQMAEDKHGFVIYATNLPPILGACLPEGKAVKVSFDSPTPEGYQYIGRNHPFVEQLCQIITANTINQRDDRAARAAVIRTSDVEIKTTILLFRVRNVIEEKKKHHQLVAEEMLLWGYRGSGSDGDFLQTEEARELLLAARPTQNTARPAQQSFLENELEQIDDLQSDFDKVAELRAKHLVEAHERFSKFMDKKRFQVVYPVLPMDVLGVYVLLPG